MHHTVYLLEWKYKIRCVIFSAAFKIALSLTNRSLVIEKIEQDQLNNKVN